MSRLEAKDVTAGRRSGVTGDLRREQRESSREAILDAAESVFADFGYEGATMKHIAQEAGMAQGLLHYYFQTKERLYEELFIRRAVAINSFRTDSVKSILEGPDATLEMVLDVMFSPASAAQGSALLSGTAFSRIVSAAVISDDARSRAIVKTHYDPIARTFIAAFRQVLPKLGEEDAVWSYLFAHAARMLIYARTGRAQRLSNKSLGEDDTPAALERVKRYTAAGIRALAAEALPPIVGNQRRQPRRPPLPKA